jgi:hypothetical protein
MITQKEMVPAVVNCVKGYGERLVDEKAFLISLSLGIPIDDFYEVDGHLTYRGLTDNYVANCEEYLSVINRYDDGTVLKASVYMFDLISRGKRGELDEKTSKLLSELGIFHG